MRSETTPPAISRLVATDREQPPSVHTEAFISTKGLSRQSAARLTSARMLVAYCLRSAACVHGESISVQFWRFPAPRLMV